MYPDVLWPLPGMSFNMVVNYNDIFIVLIKVKLIWLESIYYVTFLTFGNFLYPILFVYGR